MDLNGIIEVCDALGLKYGREREVPFRGPHVSISCPLAPWRHQDPDDKNTGCSVTINSEGPSVAKCFSGACNFEGTWYTLIQTAVTKREPPPPHLLELVKKIGEGERIDLEGVFTRACYVIDQMTASISQLLSPGKVITGPTMRIVNFGQNAEREILEEVVLDQFDHSVPRYVLTRGIKIETAKRWELRYDTRLHRVVFPARRMDGKLIGMTGRILPTFDVMDHNGERPTKYHNYTGLNKTRYLYGAHFFRIGLDIVITEGPFDAVKTDQALAGRAAVCATLGQGFSVDHRKTIASAQPRRVLLFTDNDLAGAISAEKIESQLNGVAPVFLMTATGGKDPGGMTDEAIVTAYESAKPLLMGGVGRRLPL